MAKQGQTGERNGPLWCYVKFGGSNLKPIDNMQNNPITLYIEMQYSNYPMWNYKFQHPLT